MMKFALFVTAVAVFKPKKAAKEDASVNDQQISSALGSIDVGCLSTSCSNQLDTCATGGDKECHKRLRCVQEDIQKDGADVGLKEATPCFEGMQWQHLDSGMAQIIDCGKHHSCLSVSQEGMSFLETTLNERHIPTMDQRMSLIQLQDQIKDKTQKQMGQMANAMTLLKAHLEYMNEAKSQVSQTTSLIQMVANETSLGAEDKMQALATLNNHLVDIKNGVATQQAKMATLAGFAGPEAMQEAMKDFADGKTPPALDASSLFQALSPSPPLALDEVKSTEGESKSINLRHTKK
jgi:hypothetical protein